MSKIKGLAGLSAAATSGSAGERPRAGGRRPPGPALSMKVGQVEVACEDARHLFQTTCGSEAAALTALFEHVTADHPELAQQLNCEARRLSGANPRFWRTTRYRQQWLLQVLKYRLVTGVVSAAVNRRHGPPPQGRRSQS